MTSPAVPGGSPSPPHAGRASPDAAHGNLHMPNFKERSQKPTIIKESERIKTDQINKKSRDDRVTRRRRRLLKTGLLHQRRRLILTPSHLPSILALNNNSCELFRRLVIRRRGRRRPKTFKKTKKNFSTSSRKIKKNRDQTRRSCSRPHFPGDG